MPEGNRGGTGAVPAPGDHACFFYEHDIEAAVCLERLTAAGIERGEKMLLIGAPSGVLTGLERIDAGPEELPELLDAEKKSALSSGFTTLRAAIFMDRVMGQNPSLRHESSERPPSSEPPVLFAFELGIDEVVSTGGCSVLCLFDRRFFDAEFLLHALVRHPHAGTGGWLFDNPYFLVPGEPLRPPLHEAVFQTCLDNLAAFGGGASTPRAWDSSFRRLISMAGVLFFTVSVDGRFTYLDAAIEGLTGRPAFELLGKKFFSLFAPEDQQNAREAVEQVMAGQIRLQVRLRIEGAEGVTKICQFDLAPLESAGKISGMMGKVRDITQSETERAALAEHGRSYRSLTQNLAGILYRVHLRENNRMEFFNSSVEELTGYTASQLHAGEVCAIDPLIPPRERSRVAAEVNRAVSENRPFSVEYPLLRKDGSVRYMLEQGTPVWKNGSPLHIDGVILDVTAWTSAREALEARAHHQKSVIALGREALSGEQIQDLLEKAVSRVYETLGAEYCRLLQLLPGGQRLVVMAEAGAGNEKKNEQKLPADDDNGLDVDTLLRAALRSREPVLFSDAGRENRHAAGSPSGRSRMCTVVPGTAYPSGASATMPYGVLDVHGPPGRAFGQEDADFLQAVANLISAAVERANLESLLREKEESYRAQYEGTPIPTYTWRRIGDDFVLEGCNQAASRQTEGRVEAFFGTALRSMYADMPDILKDFDRCYSEKSVIRREMDYRFRGTDRTGRFSISYAYIPPDRVLVHTEDITEKENARKKLAAYARRMKMLNEIDWAILRTRQARAIVGGALRGLHDVVPFTGADVMVFDRAARRASVLAVYRDGGKLNIAGTDVPLPLLGDLTRLRTGEVEVIEDLVAAAQGEERYRTLAKKGARSYVRIPLLAGGEFVGLLNIGFDRPGAFTAEQIDAACEVGRRVAIGIQQERLHVQLERSRNRLRLLARRLVTDREDERQRFFRELHEDIAQTLSAVKLRLRLLEGELTGRGKPPLRRLGEVMENVDRLIEKTQALAYTLRPPLLDVLGPETAFENLCRSIEKRSGVRIEYKGTILRKLPELTAITLYRVLQETLVEALRHEGVRCIRVSVRTSVKNALLSVSDYGAVSGGDASRGLQQEGSLSAAREIVEILDGSLSVSSRAGSGTRMTVRLPLDPSSG